MESAREPLGADCAVGLPAGRSLVAAARSLTLGFLALVLIASGCSPDSLLGQDSDNADDSAVPFEVQALGALAIPDGPPLTQEFGAGAGSVKIEEGASLRVPEGAFDSPTNVTIQKYALMFDQYLEGGPTGSVFVVSTEEEVLLGTSVFLEVEGPASSLRVVQFSDGEQTTVDAEDAGETTSIAIEHFSTVSTFIAKFVPGRAAVLSAQNPELSDANYLRACLSLIYVLLGGGDEGYEDSTGEDVSDSEWAGALAASVCTRSLIDRVTGNVEWVSTECVGSHIDDGTDFRAAVAECLAENETASDARSESSNVAEEGNIEGATGGEQLDFVRFSGSTSDTTGKNPDLVEVEFRVTVEAGHVVMDLTLSEHLWDRGGPDGGQSGDQNCGLTRRDVLRFEGPAGHPTALQGIIQETTILDIHGALCDGDYSYLEHKVGGKGAAFEGQLNELGVEGELRYGWAGNIAISSTDK